jgi:hypothetical protein
VQLRPPKGIRTVAPQLRGGQAGKSLIMAASHWGTFKLTDEPMDEPPGKMRELWQAAGLGPDALWIMHHGETRNL